MGRRTYGGRIEVEDGRMRRMDEVMHESMHGGRRPMGSVVAVILACLIVVATACSGSTGGRVIDRSDASTTTVTSSTTTLVATTVAPTTTPSITAPVTAVPPSSTSARDRLAVLSIDDRPSPQGSYRRADWPHWQDIDGNGCDARQDALVAWSIVSATVNRSRTCRVVAGSWVSPYDGVVSNNPSDFDIDHLVPLEEAFRSGGWQWTSDRRRAFANDPAELVVASAHSNRSKGSQTPNEWRPDDRGSWCAYADQWVAVKSAWGLTATTSERDALGQMLDTCTDAGPVWPRGAGAPHTSPAPNVG